MKFEISRLDGEEPPCEGAVKESYTHTQRVKALNPAKAAKLNLEKYRVVDGYIERDVVLEHWTIEIDDLEGLWKLADEVGEIVVVPQIVSGVGQLPILQIFGDYRE